MSQNDHYRFQKFLYEQNCNQHTKTSTLPDEWGHSQMTEMKIDENIFVMKNDLHLNQNIKADTDSTINGLFLTFYFQGDMEYQSVVSDYKVKSKNNFTNMSIFNQEVGTDSLSSGVLKSLNIVIKKEFLTQNFPKTYQHQALLELLNQQHCAKNLKNKQTGIEAAFIAKELYQYQRDGHFERILMHAKVLELIYLELQTMFDYNAPFFSDQ